MMEQSDHNSSKESHQALQVAFQTMKERCHQLQARLLAVEEENISLRLKCDHNEHSQGLIDINEDGGFVHNLQLNINELKKQKSVLANHIAMVATENKQLWRRLTHLTRSNSLNIEDSTAAHIPESTTSHLSLQKTPAESIYSFCDISNVIKNEKSDETSLTKDKEQENSLEEISLKLVNSIMLEKLELEQPFSQLKLSNMNSSDYNLENMGYTYPENITVNSFSNLKYHDYKLKQIKDTLLSHQGKLKDILQNVKKIKKKEDTCKACVEKSKKLMCQTGTQFDSSLSTSLQENESTQTSLETYDIMPEDEAEGEDDDEDDVDEQIRSLQEDHHICPICGSIYKKGSFDSFHEHVVNHFSPSSISNTFEMVT